MMTLNKIRLMTLENGPTFSEHILDLGRQSGEINNDYAALLYGEIQKATIEFWKRKNLIDIDRVIKLPYT